MLARKNRISKSEFPSAKDRGVRFLSALFSGVFYFTKGATKFSVVVSKKVAKTAIERNKIRRQFYAATEPYIAKGGAVVVLYPKKEAVVATYVGIKKEVHKEFEKIGLRT